MLTITNADGKRFDLPEGFSIEIEETNPVFNERGSQSVPVTLPPSPLNKQLTGFASRLDTASAPGRLPECTVSDGAAYVRTGHINVDSAGGVSGISINIGFDNSTVYHEWQKKKLRDINFPYTFFQTDDELRAAVDALLLSKGSSELEERYAMFPVTVEEPEPAEDGTVYSVQLNSINSDTEYWQERTVRQMIDNVLTDVTVPPFYGLTVFMRVWYLLELVFADLGYTMESNPLKNIQELSRLVVINNTGDALCTKVIKPEELMPDCTVEDFMKALWVRFGLVYTINPDRRTVRCRLLRDILLVSASGCPDFTFRMSSPPEITYNAPQYIRLSAQTSLPDAGAYSETMDGIRKATHDMMHLTVKAEKYSLLDTPQLNLVSGRVIVRHSEGNEVELLGTAFTAYDPQTVGLDALELSSPDDFVPTISYSRDDQNPRFLVGARHFHSEIKGIPEYLRSEPECPLSFMFALGSKGYTIPYCMPLEHDKYRADYVSSEHRLSLLFDTPDGLFERFWSSYDRILRHDNRSVECEALFTKKDLRQIDMLQPVKIHGVLCLIDTLTYSLPAGNIVKVKMKLRPIQTMGTFDLVAEQKVDPLEWAT